MNLGMSEEVISTAQIAIPSLFERRDHIDPRRIHLCKTQKKQPSELILCNQ